MTADTPSIQDYISPLKRLAKIPQAQLGGVACFFIKNGAIISSGINHNPTGGPMEMMLDGKLISRPEVIHAEIDAIQKAARNSVDLSGATLIVTMSPCIKCAHEITKTGINELKYLYEWWDAAALNTLREHGIRTEKIKEER